MNDSKRLKKMLRDGAFIGSINIREEWVMAHASAHSCMHSKGGALFDALTPLGVELFVVKAPDGAVEARCQVRNGEHGQVYGKHFGTLRKWLKNEGIKPSYDGLWDIKELDVSLSETLILKENVYESCVDEESRSTYINKEYVFKKETVLKSCDSWRARDYIKDWAEEQFKSTEEYRILKNKNLKSLEVNSYRYAIDQEDVPAIGFFEYPGAYCLVKDIEVEVMVKAVTRETYKKYRIEKETMIKKGDSYMSIYCDKERTFTPDDNIRYISKSEYSRILHEEKYGVDNWDDYEQELPRGNFWA